MADLERFEFRVERLKATGLLGNRRVLLLESGDELCSASALRLHVVASLTQLHAQFALFRVTHAQLERTNNDDYYLITASKRRHIALSSMF